MTFASDDADRVLFADALIDVPGLRDVKTLHRARLLKFVRDETYRQLNSGVRSRDELLRNVEARAGEEFGSIIALAIIAAIVQFIVLGILKRVFPEWLDG